MTQVNYESGKRTPDGNYLHGLGVAGGDVGFVLFGQRSTAESLYSLGAARVVPRLAAKLKIDGDALIGIFDMVAEDEANSWGNSTERLMPEETVQELIDTLVVNGKLLGQVYRGVQTAMHEENLHTTGAQLAAIVLTLVRVFKEPKRFEQDIVSATVRVALWDGRPRGAG